VPTFKYKDKLQKRKFWAYISPICREVCMDGFAWSCARGSSRRHNQPCQILSQSD